MALAPYAVHRPIHPLHLGTMRVAVRPAGRVCSRAPISTQRISALKEAEAEIEDAGSDLSEKV